MGSKTDFKTLKEYLFQGNKTFVIPNYQRGYKWAVKENDKPSAVEKLIEDLKTADWNQQYFLQGITVVEDDEKIILIDGQQRTTTLYLLLWELEKEYFNQINLEYDIREKSRDFINQLKDDEFDYNSFDKEDNIQDVYYFKKAIEQIKSNLPDTKEEFIDFLLNKVTILYIVIDKDKATKTFTMMNGSKATMLGEELSKAEILRRISLPDESDQKQLSSLNINLENISLDEIKEIFAKDWETNALRSRYAREWDKWLYWWNRDDVKEFFGVKTPMGLLLDYFLKRKRNDDSKFSFDCFRALLNENDKTQKQKTKLIFKELKDLQKSFEDIFNDPVIYNYLGLALIDAGQDKFNVVSYFIDNKKKKEKLADYSKWRLVGAKHKQIVSENLQDNEEKKEDKALFQLNMLLDDFAYYNSYNIVSKQLLRLNVEEDNKLFKGKGRKFDFSIYGNKSLEHIYPKSKVYHINIEGKLVDGNGNLIEKNEEDLEKDKIWLNREIFEGKGTEHCVGNLVLLDKNENSQFNDKPFSEKKNIYFDINKGFKSRNLLHTISVFSKSKWGKDEIIENKKQFIERFKTDYNIKENE